MGRTDPTAVRRVVWFEDLGLGQLDEVGGKGANLGELAGAGFPVPPGFVITASAQLQAMAGAGCREELRAAVDVARSLAADPAELAARAAALRTTVQEAGIPGDLAEQITLAVEQLGPDRPLAVRSSATGEDTAGTSFAGMHESYVDVVGVDQVLRRVLDCWMSLYGERAIAYRAEQGITAEPAIAVVVQRAVRAERSGVLFTVDPLSGRDDVVVIEGSWGLGESVVSGAVEPDTYRVDARTLVVLDARIGTKDACVSLGSGGELVHGPTDRARAAERLLSDEEVGDLARLGVRVASHYRRPMDVEWVIAEGRTWLVQARPMTGPRAERSEPAPAIGEDGTAGPVWRGLAAAAGRASGRVRILTTPQEGALLEPGEVLVAPMTSPDWVPTIRRAAALVTERGGLTCHAAIVARELGVPCVVGVHDATTALAAGTLVTVDGDRGTVTPGAAPPASAATPAPTLVPAVAVEALGTRIYVNLALADQAEAAAAAAVDGVGLLRAELLVADALGGVHPRELLARGERRKLVDRLTSSLLRITRPFGTRPVVYRSIDFRTNEFRGLEGGERFEPVESNPMIGYRGCYRYVREPDLFGLELEVLARVREETPNLHLMIPFVRTAWELEACLDLVEASALGRQRGLHRWVMAEVPSVVHRLPEYAAMGIDGVSIGSNDLTQLILGVDRDSAACADLFDASDAAVLDAIEQIIDRCRSLGLTSSLCGQAPTNDPAFAEHLVRFGIGSISVDPSAVPRLRAVVGAAERRLLLDGARAASRATAR